MLIRILLILVFFGITLPVLAQEQGSGSVSIDYFQRFVIDGGLITWLVLMPLSIATFAIITEHILTLRSSRLLGEELYHKLSAAISRGDVTSAWKLASENDSFLSSVVRKGLSELPKSHESVEYAIIEATEEQATRLFRKIEYLNIIGNVSPMIGLFGTVYGIILAFNKLVEVVRAGGVTQPDQLAEGISVALVTTFWGLIVAIPALAMYGLFRNRIDALAAQTVNNVLDLTNRVTPEMTSELESLISGKPLEK